jgi:hypothetical protein
MFKRRRSDNTMFKRRRTDNTMFKRRRTDKWTNNDPQNTTQKTNDSEA